MKEGIKVWMEGKAKPKVRQVISGGKTDWASHLSTGVTS